MEAAGRGADREAVDRPGDRRARTSVGRIAAATGACASAACRARGCRHADAAQLVDAVRRGRCSPKPPARGFSSVSAAPSVSARTQASAPSPAEAETISTRAPSPRRMISGKRGEPVHAGHGEIEQDDVDRVDGRAGRAPDRRCWRWRRSRNRASGASIVCEHRAGDDRIVDDHQPDRRAPRPSGHTAGETAIDGRVRRRRRAGTCFRASRDRTAS